MPNLTSPEIIYARVSRPLAKQLRKAMKDDDLSMVFIIRSALKEWLRKRESPEVK